MQLPPSQSPPLAPGTRLGPYEVAATIGAGGMGVVYRARDTRLNRDVALKVLPDVFAGDPDRLSRLRREAQALAALNHPNVAQIYGLEDVPGAPPALVMELVVGATLDELLAQRRSATTGETGLPISDALAIAKQIGDALEAAHEAGIVHRDLKPANVKIRDDGAVKVLDFGLAKGTYDSRTSGEMATLTSPVMTGVGVILGTAAYMAPEQARGRAVDKRADIWAFGVVVFELLTGNRLFAGDTVSDTIASVLRQEIPWDALPAQTPTNVRRLLRRCLERDPKRRLRDIGEARLTLEAKEDADTAGVDNAASPAAKPQPRFDGRLAAVGTLAILFAAVGAFSFWPRAEPPDATSTQVVRAVLPHADAGTISGWLRITPDGRDVIFTAVRNGIRRIVVRSLDRLELRVLPGTEGAEGVFLSPDAQSIGFFVGTRLKRMPLAGGPIEDLAEVPKPLIRAAAWTTRGEIITGVPPATLVRVPERGGTPTPFGDGASGTIRGAWPVASHDGRHIAFMQGGSGGVEDDFLSVLSFDTGALQKTTIVTREPVAMFEGHLLFRRADHALMAVRFDEREGRIVGEPVQVLEPSTTAAVSASGTAVYLADDGREMLTIREGDRSQPLWQPPWTPREPRVSPTGGAVALASDGAGDADQVWTYDPATGTPTKIADRATRPSWTPDGRSVTYLRSRPGLQPMREVYSRPRDASGSETLLFSTETMRVTDAQVMKDGSALLVTADAPAGNSLYRVPLAGDRTPVPLIDGEPSLAQARLSPDGSWVAFASSTSGSQEVYARQIAGAGVRLTVSVGGGNTPVWSGTGRDIYYRQGDTFVRATLEFAPAPRVIKRETVLTGVFSRRGRWAYDVMPDGRLLVFEPQAGSTRLVVVHNWIAEVRDRLAGSR